MKTYRIHRLRGSLAADEALRSAVWDASEAAHIDEFPWYKAGEKQATEVRLLSDGEALHALFIAQDRHSSAEERELNGMVCRDSCVEFFFNPWPQALHTYFNCEANCCGALHVGFRGGGQPSRHVTAREAERITIRATFPATTKEESPDDREWRLYLRVPRAILAAMAGQEPVLAGEWRGNFYRCGGRTDAQYVCWNRIVSRFPSFHRPEQFGTLLFV